MLGSPCPSSGALGQGATGIPVASLTRGRGVVSIPSELAMA